VTPHVQGGGDIGAIEVRKNGRQAGRYFHRLVTGYRPGEAGTPPAEGADRDE